MDDEDNPLARKRVAKTKPKIDVKKQAKFENLFGTTQPETKNTEFDSNLLNPETAQLGSR